MGLTLICLSVLIVPCRKDAAFEALVEEYIAGIPSKAGTNTEPIVIEDEPITIDD